MKRQTEYVAFTAAVAIMLAVVLAIYGYSGSYNIGADDPHWAVTHKVVRTVRDRSIRSRSADIQVPNLNDPALILKGAGQYDAMCTGCHLKPGVNNSELRAGMYPQPPKLSGIQVDPRDAFWIIKHGIKMSAMPAWGASHDDQTIWSMVAFVQKLPGMTPEQYHDIVAKAPPDDDMDMDSDSEHSHSHHAAEGDEPQNADTSAPASNETGKYAAGLKAGAVPEAEAAAQDFLDALRSGDRVKILRLLAPEAQITEGNETQSVKQYAGHHMSEDVAFLKHSELTVVSRTSAATGDTARVISETNIIGTTNGRAARLRSREQMGLKRIGDQWKIVSIEWSSHPLAE
ncbi:MAG: c-type cytochrome [Proteobacteria bacterium]|nr:c-type cytochrome [Pseudomonadota bacterium]